MARVACGLVGGCDLLSVYINCQRSGWYRNYFWRKDTRGRSETSATYRSALALFLSSIFTTAVWLTFNLLAISFLGRPNSAAILTARSLSSGGYLLCIFMTPSSQMMGPPGPPERFSCRLHPKQDRSRREKQPLTLVPAQINTLADKRDFASPLPTCCR